MGRRQLLKRAGVLLKQAASADAPVTATAGRQAVPIFDLQNSVVKSNKFLSTLAGGSAATGGNRGHLKFQLVRMLA